MNRIATIAIIALIVLAAFAKMLISEERKTWQDPEKVIAQLSIKPDCKICDLGCGPGFFTTAFAKKVDERRGGKVFAVDSDPKMLEYLRVRLVRMKMKKNRVELVCSDVASTGMPDGTMDIAFFADVLHDIGDKVAFLKEVWRICRERAQVVDIDWKRDEQNSVGPPQSIRISEDEALELFIKEGFRLEKRIYGGNYHYGLLFMKR